MTIIIERDGDRAVMESLEFYIMFRRESGMGRGFGDCFGSPGLPAWSYIVRYEKGLGLD